MVHVTTRQLTEDLAATLRRVTAEGERVVLRKGSKDMVAIVSLDDLALLEELEDRQDLEDARAELARAREEGTVPLATIKKRLGML